MRTAQPNNRRWFGSAVPLPETSPDFIGTVTRVSQFANAAPLPRPADLEIGDTAGLETCGTSAVTPLATPIAKYRDGLAQFRLRAAGCICLALLWLTTRAGADDVLFRNCLAGGDQCARAGDVTGALRIYLAAEQTSAGNATNLCVLTKEYCNLMRESSAPDLQKTLAETAFKCAQAALQADPQNPTAHVCVAVTLAKMFPYVSNQTKVVYSRRIKAECERAIATDPRQDVAYYLLGRWNFGVANMNFLYKGLVRLIYGGLPPASNAEAIKDLQRAVAINPARIIHHRELAKIYAALGQKAAARQQLELCARLKPVDPDDEDAQAEAARELSTL